jgi:ribosomal protein S21
MSISITVREGEDLEQVLQRFRVLVHKERSRPWDERRFGYHEKPSAIRRKQRCGERSRIGLGAQWARTGPRNAVGR